MLMAEQRRARRRGRRGRRLRRPAQHERAHQIEQAGPELRIGPDLLDQPAWAAY